MAPGDPATVSGMPWGRRVINHLRASVAIVLAVGLLAWAPLAAALGLGQIQVKSKRDEPLLAEIPIVSTDPTELQALQARLASPATFARVGLDPPQGVVSNLQFSVALDARGRPVIRVTSPVPVQQPLLTFLIEVDWGQGRLVREYSALLDAPQSAEAPAQPPIEEATTDDDLIAREPVALPADPLNADAPVPIPLPTRPQTAATDLDPLSADAPVGIPLSPDPQAGQGTVAEATPETAPPPREITAVPAPLPAPAGRESTDRGSAGSASSRRPPADSAGSTTPGGTRTVRQGETLSGIAAEMGGGYRLDQALVALLRANPDAFIDGNVNLVKAGAVLRIPDGETIAGYSPDEAALLVREQTAQWRNAGRALPQPPSVAGAAPANGAASSAQAGDSSSRASGARLEIVPPAERRSGDAVTQSGISTSGGGDMLRQQDNIQTQESLVAREAEVQELKARVAELEQLQDKQQQLIALKDTELASAQQQLAARQDAPGAGGMGLWMVIGAVALVLGGLIVVLLRRRPAEVPTDSGRTARLAAALPTGDDTPPPTPAWSRDDDHRSSRQDADVDLSDPGLPDAIGKVPTWHAGGDASFGSASAADGSDVPSLNAAPAGRSRIELARAYLEMGDRSTAVGLLREVAAYGDAEDSAEAARLLSELA